MAARSLTTVFALGAIATAALTGCGGGLQVRALVPVPPDLPVRVFPELAVVYGTAPDDLAVSDALARHLAASSDGARVAHLDEHALDARRANGRFGPASAVLRVDTRVLETTRPAFVTHPETVCTAYGCQTYRRTTVEDRPVVVATVVLRVFEGRSDRLLQELRLEEREEGSDALSMRLRVLTRLRERVISSVDPGQRQVRIELLDVDDGEVRAALEALRGGHVLEARAALERITEREGFERRPAAVRARVLFDLGQARRLDARVVPPDLEEARLAEAEATIRLALRTHPEAVYARALDQIEEERTARARMRAHADATTHNFALDRAGGALPEVPRAYREAVVGD